MTQEYYIVAGKNRTGPHDLVSIVRKIRNGTLTPLTPLQQSEASEPKPASEWAELGEFFAEKKEDRPASAEQRAPAERRGLGTTLQTGWRFLQRNQYSTVFSGVFVLLIILAVTGISSVAPEHTHFFIYAALGVLAHFILSCYMLSILRMARGQPVDPAYMEAKIVPAIKSLLMSSVLICLPAILGLGLLTSGLPTAGLLVGLFIFAVPGLFALSVYAFTPLLILDKGCEFWEAMETSRKTVLKSGMETAGVVYALFVINFLAGLCIILPMALSLPITTGSLADMYDEMFA